MSLLLDAPSAPSASPVLTPDEPSTSFPATVPLAIPPCAPSSRLQIPTSLGLEHRESVLKAKAHLDKCRTARASHLAAAHVPELAPVIDGDELPLADAAAPGVVEEAEPMGPPAALPIMDASTVAAVVDCEHAGIVCEEVAMLTIHCETCQNPSNAHYNLRLPPAMYEEALLHPNAH
jgi:hypothetical protein